MKLHAKHRLQLTAADSNSSFKSKLVELAKNNKESRKLVAGAKSFFAYLESFDYADANPSAPDIVTAAKLSKPQVTSALWFAAYVSNVLWDTPLKVPAKIWRTDLVATAPTQGSTLLYRHATHPTFSSWTLLNLAKSPKALSILEEQRSETLKKKKLSTIILESSDAAGKVVWTPDSVKRLTAMYKFCTKYVDQAKDAPDQTIRNNLYDCNYWFKKILAELQRKTEKEVILFHPHGVRAKCVLVKETT